MTNSQTYITHLQKGSKEYYEALIDAYGVRIFRFYNKRLLDIEEAKELTQQTFIKLWRYRASLSIDFSIEQQLYTIARGLLINYYRSKDSQARLKKNYRASILKLDTEEVQIKFEQADNVESYLSNLSHIQQKIIRLKIIQGYSNKEISNLLSLSIKTIESHISKAYKLLRELL